MHYKYSQKKAAAADRNTKERDYWLERLSGELTKACFHYDKQAGGAGSGRRDTFTFRLAGDLFAGLSRLSRNSPHALHMIVAAAVTILLGRYAGQDDIIIGTPIYKQEVEGEFINTLLALRNRVEASLTFKEYLMQVRKTVTEAVENQNYPVEVLLQKLNMEFSAGDFPLFDVVVLVENVHDRTYIQPITPNVMFSFLQTGEAVEGVLEYNPALYDRTVIERIAGHLTCLLRAVTKNPDLELGEIPILPAEERKRLLFEFNACKHAFSRDRCYPRLFEEQVARGPGRTVSVHNDRHITYGELNVRANRLGALLREKGLTPDHLTALLCERSNEMLTGIIAIFKAGGAYIPIGIDFPPQRIKTILADSEARILLTTSTAVSRMGDLLFYDVVGVDTQVKDIIYLDPPGAAFPGFPQTGGALREAPVPGVNVLSGSHITSYPEENLKSVNKPLDLSYVIYTSGTTGTPKGVMLHHRGMINHIEAMIHYLPLTDGDVIGQTASACFDISVWQFLGVLLTGGSIFIIDKEIILEPAMLLRAIQKGNVSVWESVPSIITAFLHHLENKSEEEIKLDSLRWLMPTGEALGYHLVKHWRRYYPGIKALNAYGPTEASDDITFYVAPDIPPADRSRGNVPIGTPIRNMHIYIMDRNLSLCPIGVRGEICTAGVGVGRGYWKDPDKTGKYFVANPYIDEIGDPDYAVLYRTGDTGYIMEDGNIQCLGRLDYQVKIRGNRIELGEIENRLANHVKISEAVVTVRTTSQDGQKYLCAYFVPEPGSAVSPGDLKDYLSGELPGYMVPPYWVRMEQLPLTPNGKIDRAVLPEPELSAAGVYVGPRNKLEEKLVEIWSGVLDLEKEKISIDADFFELGGHSLSATILISRLHKELHVKVGLVEIFKRTTITQLSGYISGMVKDKHAAIEPVEKQEYYPLSPAQKRMYIIQQLEPGSTAYNIPQIVPMEKGLDGDRLREIIEKLIRRHESFRTTFEMIADEPAQIIHSQVPSVVRSRELEPGTGTPGAELEAIVKEFVKPFDLGKAPLLRVNLLKRGDGGYYLLTDAHHIITDGLSHIILVNDFYSLYKGNELPPMRLQYKDCGAWQNREIKDGILKRQEEYWLERFSGEIPVLNLHADYPRPGVQNFKGDMITLNMDRELKNKIAAVAKEKKLTMNIILLSIYSILLAKYSNREDIVVGTVVAGRPHADLHQIIGMFVNMLPLRIRPEKNKTFNEFLDEVKREAISAYDNQDYQFDDLISKLEIQRQPGRNPLVDVVFAFWEASDVAAGEREAPGGIEKLNTNIFNITHFDLMLHAIETVDSVQMRLEYSTDLFKTSTIEEFAGYYLKTLEQAIDNPHIKLEDMRIELNLTAAGSELLREDQDDWDQVFV